MSRSGRTLLLLALGNVAVGTGMYVFLGSLGAIARDLDVGVSTTGQLASVFALTYAVASPFVVAATGRWGVRRVLTGSLAAFAVAGVASALAGTYGALMAARVGGALAASAYAPLAASAAAASVPPAARGPRPGRGDRRRRGFTPARHSPRNRRRGPGRRRATFWLGAALAAGAAAVLWVWLPAFPAVPRRSLRSLAVARRPEVAGNVGLVVAAFAAVFACVAYVEPLLVAITGLGPGAVGAFQALVGVGGVLGTVLGGRLADRAPTRATAAGLLAVVAVGIGAFSPLVWIGGTGGATAGAALALLVGSTALFAVGPVPAAPPHPGGSRRAGGRAGAQLHRRVPRAGPRCRPRRGRPRGRWRERARVGRGGHRPHRGRGRDGRADVATRA